MKREISYRFWNTKTNQMLRIESFDWQNDGYSSHATYVTIKLRLDIDGHNSKGIYQEDPEAEEKDLIPLEYTGMKDKNGKKIFEGDIVKVLEHYEGDYIEKEWIGVVKYAEPSFAVMHRNSNMWGYYEMINEQLMEVMGNIYENPELIN